jgi:hypothetical protein
MRIVGGYQHASTKLSSYMSRQEDQVHVCSGVSEPVIVNLLNEVMSLHATKWYYLVTSRRQEERNSNNFNTRWPFIFSAISESFDLREVTLSGWEFTLVCRIEVATYEKLECVLSNVAWKQKNSLFLVRALTHTIIHQDKVFMIWWRLNG